MDLYKEYLETKSENKNSVVLILKGNTYYTYNNDARRLSKIIRIIQGIT